MKQWEYLTKFVAANASSSEFSPYTEADEGESLPMYAPESMIPELNHLGAKGWELLHMQPVKLGKKQDVLMHEGGGNRQWSNQYFCVFKRPLN